MANHMDEHGPSPRWLRELKNSAFDWSRGTFNREWLPTAPSWLLCDKTSEIN
ncbi:hypothetical protein RvY_14177 [Ramazzottius varieornatus]|uniref:Uncharacterized protein n=1 Tax=Ramazzottius varieornatus TaxID=947166 RepID=A0A1D1VVI0_RAMVA|nr:hypothetical protein RvY_14177 [Ramazzottius varieornatus]